MNLVNDFHDLKLCHTLLRCISLQKHSPEDNGIVSDNDVQPAHMSSPYENLLSFSCYLLSCL